MGRAKGRIARAFGRAHSSGSRRSGKFGVVGALVTGLLATSLVTGSQLGSAAPLDSEIQRGQGFELNDGDLRFILNQIKIAEAHAAVNYDAADDSETLAGNSLTGPGKYQIGNPLLPYGLRTVDGSFNNLVPGQEHWGATGHILNRHTTPLSRDADPAWDPDGPGPNMPPLGGPTNDGSPLVNTSYNQVLAGNIVIDREPRAISNMIVDQTPSNPAAVAAAAMPIRTSFNDPSAWPCATLATAPSEVQAMFEDPSLVPDTDLADCTPDGESLDIPNVTTDFGLSPPYNSWFTFFGQFFDHGLDLTAKAGGTVYVPLKSDDPLIAGPDMVPGNGDDPVQCTNAPTNTEPPGCDADFVPMHMRFMALTRAQNLPGPDAILGTADDVRDTSNGDSSWVDQSQTYTSHPSHQVFLRAYDNSSGRPLSTGKFIEGAEPAPAWAHGPRSRPRRQRKLGIQLNDSDVHNIPLLLTDPYGRFLRGDHGFPQLVMQTNPITYVEGNPSAPVSTSGAMRTNTAVPERHRPPRRTRHGRYSITTASRRR